MVKCEECVKKLGVLEGYRHPVLGKSFLVCGNCFDKIDKNIEKWRVFCISDSINAKSSKIDLMEAWNKSISNNLPLQTWFNALWIKKDIGRYR